MSGLYSLIISINSKSFKESDLANPLTPYAWSKYLVERYIQKRDWNIRWQILRYFNVYGHYEDHKLKNKQASPFSTFSNSAALTKSITVFEGSENYYRDFIHVYQIVGMHEKLFTINQSGIWNAGSGNPRSFMSIAREIADKYDAEIQTVRMPQEMIKYYQSYTAANMDKFNAL